MYQVGDRIVYPMNGAGTIERIEKKEILGAVKDYYILNVSCGAMGVMIPVDACDSIGVRPVVSGQELDSVLDVLGQETGEMPGNWNRRYRENMDKLKTGDIRLVAEIVRNLTRMDRERGLSAGEKKMLTNARRILQSEWMLAAGIGEEEARHIIEKAI